MLRQICAKIDLKAPKAIQPTMKALYRLIAVIALFFIVFPLQARQAYGPQA